MGFDARASARAALRECSRMRCLQLLEHALRILAGTSDRNLIAMLGAKRHQRHGAARVRSAPVRSYGDLGALRLGEVRDQRRRPRMNAMLERDRELTRRFLAAGARLRDRTLGADARNSSNASPTSTCDRRSRLRDRESIAVGDQTIGVIRLFAPRASTSRSNLSSGSPALHARALLRPAPRSPCLPSATVSMPTCIKISAPFVRAHSDGMLGGGDRNDLAIARRMQRIAGRIDGHAVAQQPLREHLVGRFIQRRTPAAQRSMQRHSRTPSLNGPLQRHLRCSTPPNRSTHNGSTLFWVNVKHRSCLPVLGSNRRRRQLGHAHDFAAAGASGSTAMRSPSQPSRRTSSSPAASPAAGNWISFTSSPIWKLNGTCPTAATMPVDDREIRRP